MNDYKILPIVKQDSWLEPVAKDVWERHQRYVLKKKAIQNEFSSLYKFAGGHHYLGFTLSEDKKTLTYREWAPAAKGLYLVGDFNKWEYFTHPLKKTENGIWEIKIDLTKTPKLHHKSLIKVLVQTDKGNFNRIPAFIQRVVQDDSTKDFAGQIWLVDNYEWENTPPQSDEALLIYETHVGMAQEKGGVGTYKEFEDKILPYIKQIGYNTIQVMAIAEHPYYGSFGYHVSNFFAASSRFGTPEELKSLIDKAHGLGLRVIMDIVHSHTVKNINEGLNEFDGTDYQYFHAGSRGNHDVWDSKLFDYGKTEVLQFLLSNVRYWLEEFHFDGFRFDGVTSMLYHHHGIGVDFGDRDGYFSQGVEFDAITYLQLANDLAHEINPNAITIAEDVSGMPGLCHKIEEGGIGFDFRLAMGIPDYWIKLLKERSDEDWSMNELYHRLVDRNYHIKTIGYAESHDQALVGDKTIAFRLMDQEMYFHMHKDDQNLIIDRGVNLHNMIRFITIVLGGEAYLNFMGNEFGHPEWIDFPRAGNNWSYHYARRQWSLIKNDQLRYRYMADFDKAMLDFVKKYKILKASTPQELWIDESNNLLVFERGDMIFVFNFHPSNSLFDYQIQTHKIGQFELIFNSDAPYFGGFDRIRNAQANISKIVDGIKKMSIYAPNRSAQVYRKKY
jgi:1,4-alpha-glucan branching enzyme